MGNASTLFSSICVVSVHPHGCGERHSHLTNVLDCLGSSPRVWGTQDRKNPRNPKPRFIPTGVGNAGIVPAMTSICSVHPHGCGERINRWYEEQKSVGSSPRVWGTRHPGPAAEASHRFIPTGVGNATRPVGFFALLTVHPHGCGERQEHIWYSAFSSGSSPRVWGTLWIKRCFVIFSRFIPTGVGNASWRYGYPNCCAVHPHGCGERKKSSWCLFAVSGSSPRVWGTLLNVVVMFQAARFIPTGVGNAHPTRRLPFGPSVHPHGCGERLRERVRITSWTGSSPRVWGTHPLPGFVFRIERFIPTGVGNASPQEGRRPERPVHPHGCGERRIALWKNWYVTGSSPRVWGTLKRQGTKKSNQRFIPTGVGNAGLTLTAASNVCGSSPRVWGTRAICDALRSMLRFIPTGVGNALSVPC